MPTTMAPTPIDSAKLRVLPTLNENGATINKSGKKAIGYPNRRASEPRALRSLHRPSCVVQSVPEEHFESNGGAAIIQRSLGDIDN